MFDSSFPAKSLDDIVIPATTLREAIEKCFNDDWNSRKSALNAKPGQTLHMHFSFTLECTAEAAKAALADLTKREAGGS